MTIVAAAAASAAVVVVFAVATTCCTECQQQHQVVTMAVALFVVSDAHCDSVEFPNKKRHLIMGGFMMDGACCHI